MTAKRWSTIGMVALYLLPAVAVVLLDRVVVLVAAGRLGPHAQPRQQPVGQRPHQDPAQDEPQAQPQRGGGELGQHDEDGVPRGGHHGRGEPPQAEHAADVEGVLLRGAGADLDVLSSRGEEDVGHLLRAVGEIAAQLQVAGAAKLHPRPFTNAATEPVDGAAANPGETGYVPIVQNGVNVGYTITGVGKEPGTVITTLRSGQ